jgi:hypothetical protein
MAGFTQEQIAYMMARRGDDLRPNLIASLVICLLVSYTSVILRVVCRKLRRAPLLADDWLIFVSLVRIALLLSKLHRP